MTRNRNIILLPVRHEYAHAIFLGKKTVEFRKTSVPDNITHIVVYSCRPDSAVLWYCGVSNCIELPPGLLWDHYGRMGAVDKDDFFNYYRGCQVGRCYILENPVSFQVPIHLDELQSVFAPPRSFAYLSEDDWNRINDRKIFSSGAVKAVSHLV